MKMLTIILGTILLNACFIAPAAPLIRLDKDSIERIAIDAVTAKHPNLKPADFVLTSINYSTDSDVESGTISVTLSLPATAKTTLTKEGTTKTAHTHIDGFNVLLTNDGMVLKVSQAEIVEDKAT
jgi:hypothetical protein